MSRQWQFPALYENLTGRSYLAGFTAVGGLKSLDWTGANTPRNLPGQLPSAESEGGAEFTV